MRPGAAISAIFLPLLQAHYMRAMSESAMTVLLLLIGSFVASKEAFLDNVVGNALMRILALR